MALSHGDAAHLLRRAGFGVTPGGLGELQGFGSRADAVDRMLDVGRNPGDGFAPVINDLIDAPGLEASLTTWWLDRMATAPSPLQEKLVLFWHGHFTSSLGKVADLGLLLRQNRLLRRGALGSFHDLAQAVSVDAAMLRYLDNWANVASEPQENFGRELLEVFTLGVANRTEDDVVAMTRAWTGHGLDGAQASYVFDPAAHDPGPTSLFGLPPRSWNGPEALTELLLGARAEASSRFVTARLFSFLAYPVGDDAPVVHRLAEGFRRSRLSIHLLTRSILLSEEFWSPEARRALVRSPIEWTVAALQGIGRSAQMVQPTEWLHAAGQAPFNPPTVAGWGQNRYWLATSASWARAGLAAEMAASAANKGVLADTEDMTPADAANRAFYQFGIVDPSPATRQVIERFVERTRAEADPADLPRNLVHLVLLSPDFQLA